LLCSRGGSDAPHFLFNKVERGHSRLAGEFVLAPLAGWSSGPPRPAGTPRPHRRAPALPPLVACPGRAGAWRLRRPGGSNAVARPVAPDPAPPPSGCHAPAFPERVSRWRYRRER
jgi:hypothetical protein